MRSAREPSVYADIEMKVTTCDIVVGNCGESPAFNVSFQFSEPCPIHDINDIPAATKTLSKKPITFLAPKTKLKFSGGFIDRVPQQDLPDLNIRIDYENEDGKKFTRNCRVNLLSLQNLLFASFHDPSDNITEAIEHASTGINNWLEQGVRAVAYSADANKDRRRRVPCPACAEMILQEAKKCHFCQEPIKHVELVSAEIL